MTVQCRCWQELACMYTECAWLDRIC